MKIAKNEHSNSYHYYFKVNFSFQYLTTIRYGKQGIWWACANLRCGSGGGEGGGGAGGGRGEGGQGVWTPSENHVIWVDLDLNPLLPLTKFPGSAHGGGGGNLFHWNALEQIA